MAYFSLKKQDPEPDAESVEELELEHSPEPAEEAEEAAEQEPKGKKAAPGLLPGLCLGARDWCIWCSARIGVGPTWAVHAVGIYAVFRYQAWVGVGIGSTFLLCALLFTPEKTLERLTLRVDARYATWEGRRRARTAGAEELPAEAGEKPEEGRSGDPLVALMWRHIGTASGVHRKTLAEVLSKASVEAGGNPFSGADVEAALGARRIPLRDSVRDARGKVNRGVHRADLEAWEQALSRAEDVPPLQDVADNVVAR